MKNITILAFLVASASAMSQTWGPGAGGAIPDNDPTGFSSTINVAGAATLVTLDSVELNFVNHTWAGDLEVELTGPNGMSVHLFSRVLGDGTTTFGDSSDLIGIYTFVNSGGGDFNAAAASVGAAAAIPNGSYNRSTTPGGFANPPANNNGYEVFNNIDPNGNWTLTIVDWAGGDIGDLASWSFTGTTVPEPGTIVAIGLGLAGLALARRRK